MVKISLTLKQHPIENRKNCLKQYMAKANKWLRQLKNKYSGIDLFQGIFVPFRKEITHTFNSSLIVRIIENEVTCFNTKMRVPYRVVIETIDIKDLKLYKKRKIDAEPEENQSQISDDFEIEELIEENLPQTIEINIDKQNAANQKINKYQNFDKWAKEQEEEEATQNNLINEIKKGFTFKQLINKTEDNTSIENFHKLFKRRVTLEKSDIHEPLKKQKQQQIKIYPTITEPERKKAFETNIKRFNIYFKQGRRIVRRNSVQKESSLKESSRNSAFQKVKRRRKSIKDLKVKDVLDFFNKIIKEYPKQEKQIQMIYRYLHYDVIEKKILAFDDLSTKNITQVEFPRKFGPWEDVWEDKMEIIRQNSPFSHFESYQIRSVIFKGGDDLRQELLAMQLIQKFKTIFQKAGLPLWLRPYEIIVTSSSSGILEFLPNTLSIDGLKKKVQGFTTMLDFYEKCFGDQFEKAQKNFIDSLGGYALVCYLLQFKDRHNGNILIDYKGYLIHIDYGFMFSISPGGINFENAPFKLTKEYVQLMGGKDSDLFSYFKNIIYMGLQELQKYVSEIVFLVEIMMEQSDLPCFDKFDINVFRERFKENLDQKGLIEYANRLVNDSYDNWRTKQYDNFQKMTNGILP